MRGRVERGRDAVSNTLAAVRATVVRRDARAVLVGVSFLYLGLYLYALGHLRFTGDGFDYVAVSDPLSRMFRSTGTLSFEPVAGLVVGPVELLVAPVNVAIGGALALLVGVNLAVSYLAWRHPVACGVGGGAKGSGLLAGLPALLSGSACCGPVVLVALGVQASGVLLASFDLLIPAAALLLVGSLVYVGRSVDPGVVQSPA
ncbi:hypothetical protein C2R22_09075 [Salinigranum rubrum]|uniref:Uncharacterized protein n=1 Tax=Salinigranum rubrum TaxID=755307 RepID=A0A2I8VIM7_9EURY|nr:hypothetical protein [Salinigranum rubrum]AUV81782.1 hypothetical protein C2R22_09075 [Salinigranum rubrum]